MPSSTRVWVVFGAALLAGGVTAAEPRDEDRRPVPLRTPPLVTPIETAGTGLAPEVRVRLAIDPRGRVVSVDVLSIEPASEFDERFAAVTRTTMLDWRYAPALDAGRPVAAELEWTVQFPERQPPATDEPEFDYRRLDGTAAGVDDPWQQILALPVEARRRLLDRVAATARGHLDPGKTKHHQSARFEVWTDIPRAGAARTIAEDLEGAFDVLTDLFTPAIEPRASAFRLVVVVYATHEQFVALSRDVLRVEWAAGFYNPAGLLALHAGLATGESVAATLLHEATHAFVDNRLARPATVLPRWLGEGFAEYVGNSAIRRGVFIPGRTPRAQVYWRGSRTGLGRSEQVLGVDRVRRALRDGSAPSIPEMVAAKPQTFYGPRRELFYATAWLFIHFLRHGEPEWADREFPHLMLYAAEGFPVREALQSVYGLSLDGLEERFRAYVRTFWRDPP